MSRYSGCCGDEWSDQLSRYQFPGWLG